MQPAYAALAQRNLVQNAMRATIHCADLTDLPAEVKSRRFTHVIANPPYFQNTRAVAPSAPERVGQMGERCIETSRPRRHGDLYPAD